MRQVGETEGEKNAEGDGRKEEHRRERESTCNRKGRNRKDARPREDKEMARDGMGEGGERRMAHKGGRRGGG